MQKNKQAATSIQPSLIGIINKLSSFWSQHCIEIMPAPMHMGAATFHPSCVFGCLKQDHLSLAYTQPCTRPDDSRCGQSDDRLYSFHQFQVLLRPIPVNIQYLYEESLRFIGLDIQQMDSQFWSDDWKSVTLSAYGVGAEHRVNGTEICQLTYFASMGGRKVKPVVELAYGLERCLTVLGNQGIMTSRWHRDKTYKDLRGKYEAEASSCRISHEKLLALLLHSMKVAEELSTPLIAYEFFTYANHYFNLLDASGVLSADERQTFVVRLVKIMKSIASSYVEET